LPYNTQLTTLFATAAPIAAGIELDAANVAAITVTVSWGRLRV